MAHQPRDREGRLDTDTIAAVATPAGRGGVGIVRVSGPLVCDIARALTGGVPEPQHAGLRTFVDAGGEAIDRGIALYFARPHSYTGEDVLELHGHGGPVVMDLLLARVLELGARLAGAGEFSQRAFLNDRLDLAQAEAVADLIDSGSRAAARAAVRSLCGEFSTRVHELTDALVALRVYVEGALDFPDEDIEPLTDPALLQRLDELETRVGALVATAGQGCLLSEGFTVVLAGPPNAGKSSLLNRLAGYDAAIVTDVPGTTRDVLKERVTIDGMPLHVIDTAGLRLTSDPVERAGVERARAQIGQADLVLYVCDARSPQVHDGAALATDVTVIRVLNKVDLTGDAPGSVAGSTDTVRTCALSGAGLDALRTAIRRHAGYESEAGDALIARRRHLDAVRRAHEHVRTARRELNETHAGELVAEELTLAQRALGEVTGEISSDDLLGRIFSTFCVGK